MNMREVVIVEAVRTPIGRRNGKLKDIHPVVLGSLVLKEIIKRSGIEAAQVDDVVFGCVTQAGEQSLNVARSAWLTAGFPVTTPASRRSISPPTSFSQAYATSPSPVVSNR
jgi:acetyl-CoA acyltransferase